MENNTEKTPKKEEENNKAETTAIKEKETEKVKPVATALAEQIKLREEKKKKEAIKNEALINASIANKAEIIATNAISEENFNFLAHLIKSKALPTHIRTVEDALAIQQLGKELGLPTMVSFQHIVPIEGKLSPSARIQTALLIKGGLQLEVVHYGAYLYNIKGELTYSPINIYKKTTTEFKEYYVTRLSEVKATRTYADGRVQTQNFTYSLIDAKTAGLHERQNWVKMPAEMTYARCLSRISASPLGADITLGLDNATVLYDATTKKSNSHLDQDNNLILLN